MTTMPQNDREFIEDEIIRVAAENVERLPVLEKILGRLLQGLPGALRAFSGMPVDAKLENIGYMNCGAALDEIPDSWLAAVCVATPWESRFVMAMEPKLLFSLLEILLGGRSVQPLELGPRGFTSIEKRLARQVAGTILDELAHAFRPIEAVSFSLSHFESSAEATMIAAAASPCTLVNFQIDLEGRGGGVVFLIPHLALEKSREKLSELVLGETIGKDRSWERGIKSALTDTSVRVDIILRQLRVPLGKALEWQVGDVIDLGIAPGDEVLVSTSGQTVARGLMGKRRTGNAAVRITETTLDEKGT